MNIRPLTKEDYPFIDAYVKQRPWERTNKKWTGLIDPTLIETTLKNMNPNIHAVVVEDTYLLLFAVISPWFTNKTLIDEKLVFRLLDGPGKFSDVVKALEYIAKSTNTSGIMVGTALAPNDKVMVRMFQRAGFELSQSSLFKDLDCVR
jgi:hypothetical protein